MIATTLNYIESDFASADETAFEYRVRTAVPRTGGRLLRVCRRLVLAR
jgi:hypothetical protein